MKVIKIFSILTLKNHYQCKIIYTKKKNIYQNQCETFYSQNNIRTQQTYSYVTDTVKRRLTLKDKEQDKQNFSYGMSGGPL